ncbi:MAG: ABC transporter permease [Bacteroidales bacterium]|nr:ABC transporter permease [Bacteroidales bacterium]
MIKSYILVALRNLWRNRGYASLNIFGLALGLATSIFIFLYVFNELSYDRFHEKSDRIHKAWVSGMMPTGEMHDAVTAGPMAAALLADYPEVEQVVRIRQLGGWLVRNGDRLYTETEQDFMFADSTFFDLFSFELLKGDPRTCLKEPRSIVLSEEYAKKYFGDEDPIGRTLKIEQDTNVSVITGVMQDFPENSHFHCKMLGSLSTYPESGDALNWVNQNYHTYIVLREGTDVEAFEASLYDMVVKYVGPIVQQAMGIDLEQFEAAGNSYGYRLMDLTDIHLHSNLRYDIEPPGNPLYVYLFLVAAILILVIAGINFMNLATAQSSSRSREVGLRKVVGSRKSQLITQFLTESVVLSLFSLVVAVLLVYLLLPGYNNLIRIDLDFNLFSRSWILPLLVLFAILIGILSGGYPAFVLASFRPSAVLSSNKSSGSSKSLLRNMLIVLQFTTTIIILLGTVVVNRQLTFMQKKDPGFEKENVLVVHRSDVLGQQIDAFKEEITAHSNVISAANSTHIPSGGYWGNAHWLEGRGRDDIFTLAMYRTSYDFEKALNLELVQGRFFSRDMPTDSTGVVVNEAALKVLGIEDPLNTRFVQPSYVGNEDEFMPIIGVVKDFHFESMQSEIRPLAIHFMPGNFEGKIIIKLGNGNRRETIDFIQDKWERITAEHPFEYSWLDEEFGKMFDDETKTGQLLAIFSILSIFVTCLGLLGLISFATAQRTKEIGIRKIMGASIQVVMKLLSREITLLLGISAALSIPAFFGVRAWLQKFAYHLNFQWGLYILVLVLVALFVLILALLTVSFHSYRAATANPVESLRYE